MIVGKLGDFQADFWNGKCIDTKYSVFSLLVGNVRSSKSAKPKHNTMICADHFLYNI